MLFRRTILWIAVSLIAAIAVVGCGSTGAGAGDDAALTPDTTAPTIVSKSPADAATGVAINSNINALFSEAMDAGTIVSENFTLRQGTTAVSGSVSYVDERATFNPTANLAAATQYTATITTDAADQACNHLAGDQTWTFTTGSAEDTIAPTVTGNSPTAAATGVAINADVTATFSEAMDPTTILAANFTLAAGDALISGAVSYNEATDAVLTFIPAANLAGGVTYTATVASGAQDVAGNSLAQDYVWTFTTVAPVDLGTGAAGGPGPVDLGTAANFAILAKSGVSTTGTTMVTGDIGLSPAARVELTGFSETMDVGNTWSTSSYVTGKLFAADYTNPTPATLTTAISDMETAFTVAAGLTNPDYVNLGAGEVGGLTLEPGLYKWGTGLSITTDVTIWGSETATWVFQIAEGLVVANGARVTLAGGALAENIVWQVGTNASLGTTSHFEGTLLAGTNIPVNTGASVTGRLLAQTAVTLNGSAITEP